MNCLCVLGLHEKVEVIRRWNRVEVEVPRCLLPSKSWSQTFFKTIVSGRTQYGRQLVEGFDLIGSQLDKGRQVDLVYLDIFKAFDQVSHRKILSVMQTTRFSQQLTGSVWFLPSQAFSEGNCIKLISWKAFVDAVGIKGSLRIKDSFN